VMESHRERVRLAFTAQADTYASSVVIAAEDARLRFVTFVAPQPADRVLDVATGPGFLAFQFAEHAAEVVGVDLTPAMIRRAEADRQARSLEQARFQLGDAVALPFPQAAFDICTCGSAFHHFPDPVRAMAEMVRVTRPGGRVALIDIVTSEWSEKAALHNRLEQWRDPSHTRCLPLSELVALFGRAGLHDLRTTTYATLRELEEWFAISRTSAAVAERVRAGFIASMADDGTGLDVHWDGDRVCFYHTFAWIVGTRPPTDHEGLEGR